MICVTKMITYMYIIIHCSAARDWIFEFSSHHSFAFSKYNWSWRLYPKMSLKGKLRDPVVSCPTFIRIPTRASILEKDPIQPYSFTFLTNKGHYLPLNKLKQQNITFVCCHFIFICCLNFENLQFESQMALLTLHGLQAAS